ncbi:hypothetical protein CKO15_08945 [Halorhodospira abdelmalekii]|uniref:SPOR domain-containing protein n=1 Tax=Halorhodospira abdelmalekii TaxID=421629 RepID=UPI001905BD7D|nr:SPOR domain-containing protein [Halorhodospira abdelmalekii]MBK1735407.1 hypothetical protein [Halorhodospira abdelmalekii]
MVDQQADDNFEFSPDGLYRLGLRRQPFAAGPLFEDTARATQRNVILSLLQTGERIVLLRGAPQLGKSTLLQHLLGHQLPGLHMRALQATAQTTSPQLFAELFQAADTDTTAATSGSPPSAPQPPVERHHAAQRVHGARRAGLHPALLIDDAERLPPSVLTDLLDLWHELNARNEAFSLLLTTQVDTAEPTHLNGVELPTARLHTTHLLPLNEEQTAAYLELRMTDAGAEADLLSRAEKRAIFQHSAGHPVRIHEQAYRVLSERLAHRRDDQPQRTAPAINPIASTSERQRRWPLLATVALVCLAAGSVAALLIRPDLLPGIGPDLSLTDLELVDEQRAAPAVEPPPEATPEETLSLTAGGEWLARSRSVLEETPQEEATQPSSTTIVPERDPDTTAAIMQDDAEIASFSAATAPLSTTPSAARQESARPEEDEGEEDETVDRRGAAETKEETARGWIDGQQPDHYTIQLLAAGERAALERYAADLGLDEGEAHVVATLREDQVWYVLLYGSHTDRESARERIETLPEQIRQQQPWIRSLASVSEQLAAASDIAQRAEPAE